MFKRNGLAPVAEIAGRAPDADAPFADVLAPGWEVSNLEHASVDAWVERLTGPMKGSLGIYMRRMQRYDGMIAEKAAAAGLPSEVVYLAMIESGGNPTAKSPVQARGLWQFMAPTARQYGLSVGSGRDDRTDPALATDAALRYLRDLHAHFGSWYLAAAAYNAGQGRVGRVLKEVTGQTTGTDADFYRIAHRLPKETRDYVPKFIAVARVAKDPERYGFTPEYIASRPLLERPVVRTAVQRSTAKRAPARKAVTAKSSAAKRTVAAKTPAAKRTVAATTPAAKRTVTAKTPAAKRTVAAKTTAAKRTSVKATTTAKRATVKTTTAKRSTTKTSATRKTTARSTVK